MPSRATSEIDWTQPLPRVVHGSCVSLDGRALLLVGPSGSGKSSLALQLMAFGAGLVSDDLTCLAREAERIVTSCPAAPDAVFGIEARGLGILGAHSSGPTDLFAIVDLAKSNTTRLPEPQNLEVAGVSIPCIARVDSPAFPAMLLHFLRFGFRAD